MPMDTPHTVVAVGGNALGAARGRRSLEQEWAAARRTAGHLAAVAANSRRLLVTHGNGPQVGDVLRAAELAAPEVPAVSMDVAVAMTQGSIGFILARAIQDALLAAGRSEPVAALVTEVLVDAADEAFGEPTKPIGRYISAEEARERQRRLGWHVRDFGASGWRRVVASPRPVAVLQMDAVRALWASGAVVVAGGGGGIPLVHKNGRLEGVDAVVDKDLVASLMARELGADALFIATAVERVALNYGTPQERPLARMSAAEARAHMVAGHFPAGSMGPKVEAVVDFLAHGGGQAAICSIAQLTRAWAGRAGTQFVP